MTPFTIQLFGQLREQLGQDQIQLPSQGATTIATLCHDLGLAYPTILPLLQRSHWAVNQDYARPDTAVQSSDELAIIPPVSGG